MAEMIVDPTAYEELQEATGAEFADELVNTFLDEAPDMLQELKEAAGQQDAERFRRAAHSIKSNAETFGAMTLAAQARELELSSLSAASPEKAAQLGTILDETAEALRGLMNG